MEGAAIVLDGFKHNYDGARLSQLLKFSSRTSQGDWQDFDSGVAVTQEVCDGDVVKFTVSGLTTDASHTLCIVETSPAGPTATEFEPYTIFSGPQKVTLNLNHLQETEKGTVSVSGVQFVTNREAITGYHIGYCPKKTDSQKNVRVHHTNKLLRTLLMVAAN